MEVARAPHPGGARAVRVLLTAEGERTPGRLAALHRDELRRTGTALVLPTWHDDEPGGEAVRREG